MTANPHIRLKSLMSVALTATLLSTAGVVRAQCVVDSVHNMPRAADMMSRQQLSAVRVSGAGAHMVWDLSGSSVIRDGLPYAYRSGGSRVACREMSLSEGGAIFHYSVRDGGVSEAGFESNLTTVAYAKPVPYLSFPIHYGDSIGGSYEAKGRYSRLALTQHGRYAVCADAAGVIVTPCGDTLRNVLRVRVIREAATLYGASTQPHATCHVTSLLFVSGYRYPVVEEHCFSGDSTEVSAIYYCPAAMQESLADEANDALRASSAVGSGHQHSPRSSLPLTYTARNDKESQTVRYTINATATADVRMLLTDIYGVVYKSRTFTICQGDAVCESMSYAGLPLHGQFVVHVAVGDVSVSDKFSTD